MKIKSIKLKDFKRFTDLTIEGLPETAKLVVMIGPNGCGKSSVFDGLIFNDRYSKDSAYSTDISQDSPVLRAYYFRYKYPQYYLDDPEPLPEKMDIDLSEKIPMTFPDDIWDCVNVEFYHKPESSKKVHVRSANRSYSPFQLHSILSRQSHHRLSLQLRTYGRAMISDETFASNFLLLSVCQHEKMMLNHLDPYLRPIMPEHREQAEKSVELLGKIFEEFRDAIRKMFTDSGLILKYLGAPMYEGLFRFEKEGKEQLSYQNLSGGEIAVLDLLLDIVIKKIRDEETIICVDEPEAHIHTKLQGKLLEELYNLISPKSQLWIATHSIGMVRKAQDLWNTDRNSVVFLDFGNCNFDEQVTLKPITPDPNFWERTYDVALGDLAELIAPERIVLCEGKVEDASEGFDATCYNRIFAKEHPDTLFISIGSASEIKVAHKKRIPLIKAIAGGIQTIRIRDKDILKPAQIKEGLQKGIRTLTRREIENYLLADEVLIKLCQDKDKSNKTDELLAAKHNLKKKVLKSDSEEDKPDDKLKCIAADFYKRAKDILGLQSEYTGKEPERDFMKCELAPLIQPGMALYAELHKVIFGE